MVLHAWFVIVGHNRIFNHGFIAQGDLGPLLLRAGVENVLQIFRTAERPFADFFHTGGDHDMPNGGTTLERIAPYGGSAFRNHNFFQGRAVRKIHVQDLYALREHNTLQSGAMGENGGELGKRGQDRHFLQRTAIHEDAHIKRSGGGKHSTLQAGSAEGFKGNVLKALVEVQVFQRGTAHKRLLIDGRDGGGDADIG